MKVTETGDDFCPKESDFKTARTNADYIFLFPQAVIVMVVEGLTKELFVGSLTSQC